MPTSYYTNPQSAGYQKQKLGGICENCGKQFLFSAAQMARHTNITCAYCKHPQNLRAASLRWVNIKPQIEQQQAANLIGAALTGVANGLNNTSNSYKPHTYTTPTYKPPTYTTPTYKPPTHTTPIYKSLSGNKYKYDLSKPGDELRYSLDHGAQMIDELYKPITPTVGIDESAGQHGGGLITN